MQKTQLYTSWAVIASEISHVFCCVLPLAVSVASLLSGLGIAAALPVGLIQLHDLIHQYELKLIAASGLLLGLGWLLHTISLRLKCSTGAACHHPPCPPVKRKSSKILLLATALFSLNLAMYFSLHYETEIKLPAPAPHYLGPDQPDSHARFHDGHRH